MTITAESSLSGLPSETRVTATAAVALVVVVAMLVVGGGSTTATVEEAATEAAEEAGDGPGRWRLCSVFYFSPIFFLTVTAAATEGRGDAAVSSREAHSGHVVLVAVIDMLPLALALALVSLFLLSSSPFPLLPLFPPPSPSPPP
jgi:hypothetical protein